MPEAVPTNSYFHAATKSRMPKWLFITLIASSSIIVLWGVGLGILISSSKSQLLPKMQVTTALNSPTPQVNSEMGLAPVTLSPSPEPAGWKKYTHHAYSISYPPNWAIRKFNDVNIMQLYNPKTIKSTTDRTLVGASLAAQFVLLRVILTKQSPSEFVNSIQVACCTGPSPTPGVTNLFQKQSVTLHGTTGIAYTIPATNFKNWSIVFPLKENLLELSSSIISVTGHSVENTILNTLSF